MSEKINLKNFFKQNESLDILNFINKILNKFKEKVDENFLYLNKYFFYFDNYGSWKILTKNTLDKIQSYDYIPGKITKQIPFEYMIIIANNFKNLISTLNYVDDDTTFEDFIIIYLKVINQDIKELQKIKVNKEKIENIEEIKKFFEKFKKYEKKEDLTNIEKDVSKIEESTRIPTKLMEKIREKEKETKKRIEFINEQCKIMNIPPIEVELSTNLSDEDIENSSEEEEIENQEPEEEFDEEFEEEIEEEFDED